MTQTLGLSSGLGKALATSLLGRDGLFGSMKCGPAQLGGFLPPS